MVPPMPVLRVVDGGVRVREGERELDGRDLVRVGVRVRVRVGVRVRVRGRGSVSSMSATSSPLAEASPPRSSHTSHALGHARRMAAMSSAV